MCREHYKQLMPMDRLCISFKHPKTHQAPVQTTEGNWLLTLQWWLRMKESISLYEKEFKKKKTIKKILWSHGILLADSMIYFCLGHYIQVQPTLSLRRNKERGWWRTQRGWASDSAPRARVLQGWTGAGSSRVFSELKVAPAGSSLVCGLAVI